MYVGRIFICFRIGGVALKVAICDFDERYVSSLLTYLYGKCTNVTFSSFTTIEDYMASLLNNEYSYTIMGDEFYEVYKVSNEENGVASDVKEDKLIILSASIDNLQSEEAYQTIYKYGPMDGLYRMMSSSRERTSNGKSFAIYSPFHHELTEMYGISMCKMLEETENVLLIDMVNIPIIRRLIRDGPQNGIIDVIYKLENNRTWEIKDLLENYNGIDVLPMSFCPTDISSISKKQWKALLDYIDSLNYGAYVFIFEDINQGFREIIEYVDNCILINRRGDYYQKRQEEMKDFVEKIANKVTSIELQMSANNLNEGCYKIEELLTGNLFQYVRSQNY